MLKAIAQWLSLDFDIVGKAKNGAEALNQLRDLAPDVLVLSLTVPVLGNIEILQLMNTYDISVPTVLVSEKAEMVLVRAAIALGARGYVLKSQLFKDIALAVCRATSGMTFVSEPLASKLQSC